MEVISALQLQLNQATEELEKIQKGVHDQSAEIKDLSHRNEQRIRDMQESQKMFEHFRGILKLEESKLQEVIFKNIKLQQATELSISSLESLPISSDKLGCEYFHSCKNICANIENSCNIAISNDFWDVKGIEIFREVTDKKISMQKKKNLLAKDISRIEEELDKRLIEEQKSYQNILHQIELQETRNKELRSHNFQSVPGPIPYNSDKSPYQNSHYSNSRNLLSPTHPTTCSSNFTMIDSRSPGPPFRGQVPRYSSSSSAPAPNMKDNQFYPSFGGISHNYQPSQTSVGNEFQRVNSERLTSMSQGTTQPPSKNNLPNSEDLIPDGSLISNIKQPYGVDPSYTTIDKPTRSEVAAGTIISQVFVTKTITEELYDYDNNYYYNTNENEGSHYNTESNSSHSNNLTNIPTSSNSSTGTGTSTTASTDAIVPLNHQQPWFHELRKRKVSSVNVITALQDNNAMGNDDISSTLDRNKSFRSGLELYHQKAS